MFDPFEFAKRMDQLIDEFEEAVANDDNARANHTAYQITSMLMEAGKQAHGTIGHLIAKQSIYHVFNQHKRAERREVNG